MTARSLALALGGLALAVVVLVAGLYAYRAERPPVTASPSPTPTARPTPSVSATPSAVPTAAGTATSPAGSVPGPCQEMTFQAGDRPIVPPRRLGEHLQVALDAVRPGTGGGNRWLVRFFVPASAPAAAIVPLSAGVTGPSGPLTMGRYQAGPPNAGAVEVTEPVRVLPCSTTAAPGTTGTVVVAVESSAVRSGTYTLTWRDIRLPEGGTRTESWTVTLTCSIEAGAASAPPATSCR